MAETGGGQINDLRAAIKRGDQGAAVAIVRGIPGTLSNIRSFLRAINGTIAHVTSHGEIFVRNGLNGRGHWLIGEYTYTTEVEVPVRTALRQARAKHVLVIARLLARR
jgi:hypothetical protein